MLPLMLLVVILTLAGKVAADSDESSYVIRYAHEGSKCLSLISYELNEPAPLNECIPAFDGSLRRFKRVCETDQVRGGLVTVSRYEYPWSDAQCKWQPVQTKVVGKRPDYSGKCAAPPKGLGTGYYTHTVCGPLPSEVAEADQLLVKQFADELCSREQRTKARLLGKCVPVYTPNPHGLRPTMKYRRKLVVVSPPVDGSDDGTIVLRELRYVVEDEFCSSSTPQSTTTLSYDTSSACQPDPLSPGRYWSRAARSVGATSSASLPHWWAQPINAPTASPTVPPTSP